MDDLAIGSYLGGVFILYGKKGGWGTADIDLSAFSINKLGINILKSKAGYGVKVFGNIDINKDGYVDFGISCSSCSDGVKILVIYGNNYFSSNINISALNYKQKLNIKTSNLADRNSYSGKSCGDFDGDGFSDLLVVAPNSYLGQLSSGQLFVITNMFGSTTLYPTMAPNSNPKSTAVPTNIPTRFLTKFPTDCPTIRPSQTPSRWNSGTLSTSPTVVVDSEYVAPSRLPSSVFTFTPSTLPSLRPSRYPTRTPSSSPTILASVAPTIIIETTMSMFPTLVPTVNSTYQNITGSAPLSKSTLSTILYGCVASIAFACLLGCLGFIAYRHMMNSDMDDKEYTERDENNSSKDKIESAPSSLFETQVKVIFAMLHQPNTRDLVISYFDEMYGVEYIYGSMLDYLLLNESHNLDDSLETICCMCLETNLIYLNPLSYFMLCVYLTNPCWEIRAAATNAVRFVTKMKPDVIVSESVIVVIASILHVFEDSKESAVLITGDITLMRPDLISQQIWDIVWRESNNMRGCSSFEMEYALSLLKTLKVMKEKCPLLITDLMSDNDGDSMKMESEAKSCDGNQNANERLLHSREVLVDPQLDARCGINRASSSSDSMRLDVAFRLRASSSHEVRSSSPSSVSNSKSSKCSDISSSENISLSQSNLKHSTTRKVLTVAVVSSEKDGEGEGDILSWADSSSDSSSSSAAFASSSSSVSMVPWGHVTSSSSSSEGSDGESSQN